MKSLATDETGTGGCCTLPVPDLQSCRDILETTPAMIWLGDAEGACAFLNRALRSFWGVEDLAGFRWSDTLHPDDAGPLSAVFAKAMEAQQPFQVEARYRRADGVWRVLRTEARPRFAGDTFLGMVGVNIDVTEQRDAEMELRRSKEHLEFALEASGAVGVWVWDVPTDTVRADESTWRGDFGRGHKGELAGRLEDFIGLLHPEDRSRVLDAIDQAVQSGDPYRSEYRIVSPTGERWVAALGRCEHDARGRPTRFAGVTVDITDRRRREDATVMLSRELSHRIKNVFTVVQMMTTLAIREEPEAVPALERLSRRFQALGAAQMLSLPDPGVRNAQAGLRALAALIFSPYSARNLALRMEGPDLRLEPEVSNALALILHELGTNAMKYGSLSTGGAVTLSVEDRADALVLVWAESGGPTVTAPQDTGFGSRLIRASATSLGAQVEWSWLPDGLVWKMHLPAGRLVTLA